MRRSTFIYSLCICGILVSLLVHSCIFVTSNTKPEFHKNASNYTGRSELAIQSNSTRYAEKQLQSVSAERKIKNETFQQEFKQLVFNEQICRTTKPNETLDLTVLITSRSIGFRERDVIRRTWISCASNNTVNIRYVFVLGSVSNITLQTLILRESETYHDIVMFDFKDTYNNLTLKTIMGLKWASRYCHVARYVMKTDDDMWVNIPALLRKLKTVGAHLQTAVGGGCAKEHAPNRFKASKWYAPYYKRPLYPKYCSGTGYVTSMKVVQDVLKVATSVPFLHIEDIFIGLCLEKLNYTVRTISGFLNHLPSKMKLCDYKLDSVITVHRVNATLLSKVWQSTCTVNVSGI